MNMLSEQYVLVHKQYDKNKQVEHMVLQPPPIYKKKTRMNYVLLAVKLLYFLKTLL